MSMESKEIKGDEKGGEIKEIKENKSPLKFKLHRNTSVSPQWWHPDLNLFNEPIEMPVPLTELQPESATPKKVMRMEFGKGVAQTISTHHTSF